MNPRFEAYGGTATGRALADIIDVPERAIEFRLLDKLAKPAVQAVAADVAPLINALSTKSERDAASQFTGALVAQIQRELGRTLVSDRARVTDAPYKTGAVWKAFAKPTIVTALPIGARARIEFRVKKVEEVVADWELVIIARNPGRRIHRIEGVGKPVREALKEAIAYAEKWAIPFVFISDPGHLFPKADWGLNE